MSDEDLRDLSKRVNEFAAATDVPEESFLRRADSLNDAEQIQTLIDGLTLSVISYCYHRHPRGENVHEVMELLERAGTGTAEAADLDKRAEDAAALQIPFIVTLNRMLEEYYDLRRRLEHRMVELDVKLLQGE